MRYITRTIALSLFLVTIYLLYLSNHLPKLSDFGYLHSSPHNDSLHFANIQPLWSRWSKIFHDARPRAKHIRLSSNAHITAISADDPDPREAPLNRVANSDADIESLRLAHATVLEALRAEEFEEHIFSGRGIVTVGGGEYFGPIIVGLHMLRKTGCELPVEIFVADESEYEPELCDVYLPKLGAKCLVISTFLQGGTGHKFKVTHYQLKSLAMLFSSFEEILYLDSDSIPLLDPTTALFPISLYQISGLVIWPDFWIATESPLFYTIAGLSSFPSTLPKSSSEAGQLLMNKKTHLKVLLLAVYYNLHGPEYYYPLLSQGVMGQGDKETFMAAALVMNDGYYRVKTGVASVGRWDGREDRGSGMIQYHPLDDFQGQNVSDIEREATPMFLHANTPKMNAGHLVDEGDLVSVKGEHLRLWGEQKLQIEIFGKDLEKSVWEILVQTGCELERILEEWKGRKDMCPRLQEHWKEVF